MAFSYDNYTGNGATTQFSITFTYQNTSEISVTVDGVAETGLTFPSSSTVQLTSAPASGTLVQVRRTTDLTARAVDFASGSVLTEEDLDNSSIQTFHASQEAIDRANDAIALDDDDKWDAQNNVIKNVGTPTNASDATTKAYVDTGANNAASSAAAALVSQNASAASATASANSASASAGSATTSANEATDSSNSATASAASAATASTQATLATTNGAAQVALATSQADNAAASATTAATQATLATTNGAAQVALATTQANNAASSASTAATQATASASSATTSAAQATNSANSATASANSASSASNAQTAAESARDATLAAYDNFDDRYLGTKSTAPTVDNDGDALVAGALYFDSVAGAMYVYTGSAWVAAYVSGTGFLALTGGTMSGDLNFGENDKAIFGAGSDLQIYHDGSNSYVQENGTGNLRIRANDLALEKASGGEYYLLATADGALRLYYDAAQKLVTTASGISVTGSVVADGIVKSGGTGSNGQFDLARTSDGLSVGKITMTESSQVMDYNNALGSGIHSFSVNSTERMRINSSGNVGIGTASPQRVLVLSKGDSTGVQAQFTNSTTGDGASDGFTVGIDGSENAELWNFENTNMVFGTNSTERMRINNSGNVGIGTNSPSNSLTVNSGTTNVVAKFISTDADAQIHFEDNSTTDIVGIGATGDNLEYRTDQGVHLFRTGNSALERMRIDSSGNLLVGQSSQNSANAGVSIEQSGKSYFTRDGGHALDINRLNSDGDIAVFRKDGTSVGSIGAISSSGDLYISSDTVGLRFRDNINSIIPSLNGNVGSDATFNLGTGTNRFKDLYLSGGVYLGGTGSANHLDDYEEGTCTITADTDATSPTSPSSQTGYYTKIGNMVTLWCDLNNIDMTGASGTVNLTGLPFAPSSNAGNKVGSAYTNNFIFASTAQENVVVETTSTNTHLLVRINRNDNQPATNVTATGGYISNGVTDIRFTICYIVS